MIRCRSQQGAEGGCKRPRIRVVAIVTILAVGSVAIVVAVFEGVVDLVVPNPMVVKGDGLGVGIREGSRRKKHSAMTTNGVGLTIGGGNDTSQ